MCHIVADDAIFDGNLSNPAAPMQLILFADFLTLLLIFNFYLCTFGCTPAHSEPQLNGNFLGSNYGTFSCVFYCSSVAYLRLEEVKRVIKN